VSNIGIVPMFYSDVHIWPCHAIFGYAQWMVTNDLRARIGARVKAEREKAGLTGEAFCALVEQISGGSVQLPRSTLVRLEAGQRMPGLEEGTYLAQALGLTIEALMADEDSLSGRVTTVIDEFERNESRQEALSTQMDLLNAQQRVVAARMRELLAEAKRLGDADAADRLSVILNDWEREIF